ncbi:ATP-binding cassette domain-containing protein [Solimonas soli]|uniref:ATP-binding cassette domain-containing protein n=1 Tax=Solimonas soli TaxID=413479 RepID=UPI0004B4ECB4|nr:ATP-binding cassette domain-containing protein [Solimonas soli]
MTIHDASIALHGVSHQLADGRWLFRDLHETFDMRPTGLVGRNGVGKTVLARILAGAITPTAGRCERRGRAHYVGQQIAIAAGETVAGLAGLRPPLDALRRIEQGSTRAADFDVLGERWTIRDELRQELERAGLAHVGADTPAAQLSGGEATRVVLIGARLGGADLLILDEPSNHLDRDNRHALIAQLQRWPGGLIVVSHDRALLQAMQRIVELSSLGLRSYGGGYAFYAQASADQREHAAAELERRKHERRRTERALLAQRERLDRRAARGAREAASANQAPILLGLRRSRSEASGGKLRAQQAVTRDALARQVRDAAAQVEADAPLLLFAPEANAARGAPIAALRAVRLPHLRAATQYIDLTIAAGQRLGLVGANGSGKSTLLKVLAGERAPLAGTRELRVDSACLDQRLSLLDADRSIAEQLRAANARLDDGELRSRLALLGLDAERVQRPAASLSGGERMKAALALALYAERPAQLLLLDEPDNHLDLAARHALAAMLRQYRGALVIVSHDDDLLAELALTHELRATGDGWLLRVR